MRVATAAVATVAVATVAVTTAAPGEGSILDSAISMAELWRVKAAGIDPGLEFILRLVIPGCTCNMVRA